MSPSRFLSTKSPSSPQPVAIPPAEAEHVPVARIIIRFQDGQLAELVPVRDGAWGIRQPQRD